MIERRVDRRSEDDVPESTSERRRRLLELAEEHVRLFGDEEIDVEDWLDPAEVDDPVVLAELAEEIESTIALARLVKKAVGDRLLAVLGDGAVRTGDVVYVRGSASGTYRPTRDLWEWLVSTAPGEELPRMIDAIVSGIRVTPIDDLAETYGIGERTVRDTFLEYRPGNPGLQRRDLRIDRIRQTARRWWPDVDGQTTYPPRTERRESDE